MAAGYNLTLPSQDANGWTVLPSFAYTFYVDSAAGSDANPGTEAQPFASAQAAINAAVALVPGGSGGAINAAILFKCGSTWTTGLPHMRSSAGYPLNGGTSRTAPLLFGSYGASGSGGGARPLFQTSNSSGNGGGGIDLSGGSGVNSVAHIWYVGLDFHADFRDPSSPDYDATNAPISQAAGLNISINSCEDIHVEDCRFRFFQNGVSCSPAPGQSVSDIRIRRCEILDSWGGGTISAAHSQGIFIADTSQLLIDQNIIDHNGWLAGQTLDLAGGPTEFNHNIYLSSLNVGMSNVSITDNISSNASDIAIHAAQFSQTLTDVLCTGNLVIASGNGVVPDGSNWAITGNVITEMGSSPGGVAQSIDFNLGDQTDITIQDNYQINSPAFGDTGNDVAMKINSGATLTDSVWDNNIIHGRAFGPGLDSQGMDNEASSTPGCVFTPNDVSATAWADGLAAYDASLGGPGTSADFISNARNLSKSAWIPSYAAPAAIAWITGSVISQTRSHWAVDHWAVGHWYAQHWFSWTESVDANAPRACLLGTFAPLVEFSATFAPLVSEAGTFDLLVPLLATWDTCGD